jgi:hypothetical protein
MGPKAKPKPIKRTVSRRAALESTNPASITKPDVDFFELKMQVNGLRLLSQFFLTANQFNRMKLQGQYDNVSLICSSPICVYGDFSEAAKLLFCSAMHLKGSVFKPSSNANRVVSSSRSIFVEDLIESLQCSGITWVVVASAGEKSSHASLQDILWRTYTEFGYSDGYIDLATSVEVLESSIIPVLSGRSASHGGTTTIFPMFSYLGRRHGSLLWTGSLMSEGVKLKVYPSILHQLKLAITGRADLQHPKKSVACTKRRAANLQRCIPVLEAQQGIRPKLRLEFRIKLKHMHKYVTALSSHDSAVKLLHQLVNIDIYNLRVNDIIVQASRLLESLTNQLNKADKRSITSRTLQLYADCVCAVGFSYPAIVKHAFKNPLRNQKSKGALIPKEANPPKSPARLRATRKRTTSDAALSKATRNRSTLKPMRSAKDRGLAISKLESEGASLLLRKWLSLSKSQNHSSQTATPEPLAFGVIAAEVVGVTTEAPGAPENREVVAGSSGFGEDLVTNEAVLSEILSTVLMKAHPRSAKKVMCLSKTGQVAGTALDKYELAEWILAKYGRSYAASVMLKP